MTKLIHTFAICSLFVACCSAQTPTLKVLPWNDHAAAVSLTFDDARPVHLDVAIPELNKRHLRGTFFLIVSKLTRLDDWRKAQSEGQEIGNHSVSHLHPTDLNKETEETQVEDAKNFLDSNFKSKTLIFAYPYTETSPGLSFWVKKYNFAARGGRGDSNQLFIRSDFQPDWYNLPSQASCSKCDPTVYKGWIDQASAMQAWTILQIHGIGDPSTGFEPIPVSTFIYLLDYLKTETANGLWVAPFGEVAGYLRAQKILEAVRPQVADHEERLAWVVPTPFPQGVVLKVTVSGAQHTRLYQGGHELRPNKNGVYSVAFDSRELVAKGGM